MMHKRPFTLLETLIATALTVVILSTVTYLYQQIDYINNKTEAIQRDNFKLLNMENRLSEVLPRAIGEFGKEENYFFTVSDPSGIFKQGSPKSLIFTYDNGVDINKKLSNHVYGELFLDPQGRLSLATWPIKSRWPDTGLPFIKKEVLLEDVDSFSLWFFVPPDKKWMLDKTKDKPAQLKPSPEGSWVEEWSTEYKLLPGMIRLEIKRKGLTEYYVYPFPETARQIVYNH